MVMNKRGQENWVIVGWVLALAVLVIGGYALYNAFGKSNSTLTNLIGSNNNVQDIVQGCQLACSQGSIGREAWCLQNRSLNLGSEKADVVFNAQGAGRMKNGAGWFNCNEIANVVASSKDADLQKRLTVVCPAISC